MGNNKKLSERLQSAVDGGYRLQVHTATGHVEIIDAVRTLEDELEATQKALERALADRIPFAEAFAKPIRAELERVKGERDKHLEKAAHCFAVEETNAALLTERDALAAKLEKLQNEFGEERVEYNAALNKLEKVREWAETEGSLSTADRNNLYQILDSSVPSGTPSKTEQQNPSPEPTKSAEPFRVTGPGFYRQRDGGKAEVLGPDMKASWDWRGINDEGIETAWLSNGASTYGTHVLVAPWVEPAVEEEFEIVEKSLVLRKRPDGEGKGE